MLQEHPIDGHWSSWGAWSKCSKTCGDGTHTRMRTCTSPAPENGGLPCQGSSTETKECKSFACSGNGASTISIASILKDGYLELSFIFQEI